MQELIQDLLAYSRSAQDVEVSTASADLNASLKDAIEQSEITISETGAEIVVGTLPAVVADEAQLTHVFLNLLSNSLKYRRPEATPRIEISALRAGDQWTVAFKDNGIGFDPAYADRIFGLFKRLHRESEYPGTGLGLAICKRIVERYGGSIWAESGKGGGSAFYFTLPAVKEAGI